MGFRDFAEQAGVWVAGQIWLRRATTAAVVAVSLISTYHRINVDKNKVDSASGNGDNSGNVGDDSDRAPASNENIVMAQLPTNIGAKDNSAEPPADAQVTAQEEKKDDGGGGFSAPTNAGAPTPRAFFQPPPPASGNLQAKNQFVPPPDNPGPNNNNPPPPCFGSGCLPTTPPPPPNNNCPGGVCTPPPPGGSTVTFPTCGTVTPNYGLSVGGTPVVITGTNFEIGATVSFGGSACTSVVVVSPSEIHCVTGIHAATDVDLKVSDPGNLTCTKTAAYTYQAAGDLASMMWTGGAQANGNTESSTVSATSQVPQVILAPLGP